MTYIPVGLVIPRWDCEKCACWTAAEVGRSEFKTYRQVVMMCFWARHFTLTVVHSTQEHDRVATEEFIAVLMYSNPFGA